MMSPSVTLPIEEGERMWMELNEMELNGREELLNPTASTETMPHYILR